MGKRILVADDEPNILTITAFRFKKEGFDVITADNGSAALDVIQNEDIDLVLLDVHLPVMDGCEVCRRVKRNESLCHIPIILFTAADATEAAGKARAVNADDFVTKPFERDELMAKVRRFVGS